MVIDTSAIFAILAGEPEQRAFNEAIAADPVRLISAASFLEAQIALATKYGDRALRLLDDFLHEARVTIAVVDEEQARAAGAAFRHFGKGRHPAGLNFGDCFGYALAKVTGEPLLYKGQDFSKTDIASAIA